MYMEAYGNVGSVADSIIKKSITAGFSRKMAKEDIKEATHEEPAKEPKNTDVQWSEKAISKGGVSPISEGVGSKADPDTIKLEMEKVSQQKAKESLMSKIENLEGMRLHLEELVASKTKENEELIGRNKELEDKLGRRYLRK